MIVLGDSNTKNINFGKGSGRVGESYPGKRVKAAKVNEIEVNECVGYSNIFLCCGTNNMRQEYIRCDADIQNTVDELKCKLEIITQLCPRSKVFVSPVLPTRLPQMNRNIIRYNQQVNSMIQQYFPDTWFASVYSFCDNQGLLSYKLTRNGDAIHLGPRGIAKFVSHIKYCVFSREANERKFSTRKLYATSMRDHVNHVNPSQESSSSTVVGS